MRKFYVLFAMPLFVIANPIAVEIINEFQTDTTAGQKVEYHLTYPMGYGPLLNDSITTPAGTAIIDANLYLTDSTYVIIDNSVLTGPFYLPLDTGYIVAYFPNIPMSHDSLCYPYDYYYYVPVPPQGTSAAKFYCWVNSGIDMHMLKDWYIDYTPTFGDSNDDYDGCKVSGTVYGSGGTPINGAQVLADIWWDIYTPHPFYDHCTTYTTMDGHYSFDSLLPDVFVITVNAAGFQTDSQITSCLYSLLPLTNVDFYLIGIQENNGYGTDPRTSDISVHPNPFNKSLTVKFHSATMLGGPNPPQSPFSKGGQKGNSPCMKIYNAAGRLVKRFNHLTDFSFNQVSWNGTDETGRNVSPGVYFVCVPGQRLKVIKL